MRLVHSELPHCAACKAAKEQPDYHVFNAKCTSCCARHMSKSLAFFESQRAGRLTKLYFDALKATFGDDWKAGHERVKSWVRGAPIQTPANDADKAREAA